MSILFNKKIISGIFITAILIMGGFSLLNIEVVEAIRHDKGPRTGPGQTVGESNKVELGPDGRPIGKDANAEILKTGGGTKAAEKFEAYQKEKALEKQRQIQNAKREARSEFTALNPIKGVTDAEAAKNPSKFFNGMFMFGISIAAFLAVLMIAIGGIQYMSTDAVSGKSEGRERIQYAVMGLLLVLFSWILLRQINPEILNFNFLDSSAKIINLIIYV